MVERSSELSEFVFSLVVSPDSFDLRDSSPFISVGNTNLFVEFDYQGLDDNRIVRLALAKPKKMSIPKISLPTFMMAPLLSSVSNSCNLPKEILSILSDFQDIMPEKMP